jgi:hypothetical protein
MYNRDNCVPMFTVGLFKIAKYGINLDAFQQMGKQNMHIYTAEYYFVIKKNKILSSVGKWMQLEVIM